MSNGEGPTVTLKEEQVEQGAALLARVFQHAPDMTYFIGDDTRMLGKSAMRFYKAVIRTGLLYGEVTTTSSLEGLAIWMSPAATDFAFGPLFRSGLAPALLSMGFGSLVRFIRSSNFVEKLQKEAISGPRWTLVFLGVEPSMQGKGIGGHIIQPVLSRADAEGLPCYVESADERNLTFYKRHGFVIIRNGQVPKGGPPVWVMVRQPAQPAIQLGY